MNYRNIAGAAPDLLQPGSRRAPQTQLEVVSVPLSGIDSRCLSGAGRRFHVVVPCQSWHGSDDARRPGYGQRLFVRCGRRIVKHGLRSNGRRYKLLSAASVRPNFGERLTDTRCEGQHERASTSLGEASAGTQATDPERRETPRVRTAPPGLRVEPKWLPDEVPDTPCSAKALTRGVPFTPTCTSDGVPVRPGGEEVRAK
jgi:hypothetical protein